MSQNLPFSTDVGQDKLVVSLYFFSILSDEDIVPAFENKIILPEYNWILSKFNIIHVSKQFLKIFLYVRVSPD